MRDIKPNKRESGKIGLPPMSGDEYKELELYEANLPERNKSKDMCPA